MSKMKSTLAATFLTLVLAVPAFAGVIGTPGGGGPPPPPPPPAVEESGSSSSQAPEDMSSQMLVDILMAVLSLF